MYSIWNATFSEVYKDFKRKQEKKEQKIRPFYFIINDEKPKAKFKIEEMDSLTSRYKSEEDFIKALCSPEYQKNYLYNPCNPIIMTHQAKGELFQDTIIYNDKFITNISAQVRKKKKLKSKKTSIMLDNSKLLLDFIDYVKSLAIHPVSRIYLLTPEKLSATIDAEDWYLLKTSIKGDIEVKTDYYHGWKKGLRSILTQYLDYSNLLEEKTRQNESSLETQNNLNQINQELTTYFRENYQNIRNLIIWENLYQSILEKQIKQTTDRKEKEELTTCLAYVNAQKLYRNGRIESTEWGFYQDIYFGREAPLEQRKTVQNEKMAEFFQEGGIEGVWHHMSADEIYQNMEDAKTLGILGSTKKH